LTLNKAGWEHARKMTKMRTSDEDQVMRSLPGRIVSIFDRGAGTTERVWRDDGPPLPAARHA
jgi:hypothetical protein